MNDRRLIIIGFALCGTGLLLDAFAAGAMFHLQEYLGTSGRLGYLAVSALVYVAQELAVPFGVGLVCVGLTIHWIARRTSPDAAQLADSAGSCE